MKISRLNQIIITFHVHLVFNAHFSLPKLYNTSNHRFLEERDIWLCFFRSFSVAVFHLPARGVNNGSAKDRRRRYPYQRKSPPELRVHSLREKQGADAEKGESGGRF
jgi:hypothetical protein